MGRQLSEKRLGDVAEAKFKSVTVREGRLGSLPTSLLVTLIALATLLVLAVVAYRDAPWYVPIGAISVGMLAILIAWSQDGSPRQHREEDPSHTRDRRECEDPAS